MQACVGLHLCYLLACLCRCVWECVLVLCKHPSVVYMYVTMCVCVCLCTCALVHMHERCACEWASTHVYVGVYVSMWCMCVCDTHMPKTWHSLSELLCCKLVCVWNSGSWCVCFRIAYVCECVYAWGMCVYCDVLWHTYMRSKPSCHHWSCECVQVHE